MRYVKDAQIEEILCEGGRITGVAVRQGGKRAIVRGDHYLSALPIERIAPMMNSRLLAADPSLANLSALAANVEWMNGVQFYLRRDMPTTHGHVIHIDTEWALTSVSQLQFWRNVPPEFFGDSDVRGILSVDVSDWTALGSNGRPAMQCSREEVVRETWNQLKRSINAGAEILRDEDLHSWFLDADIDKDPTRPGYLKNAEPLLVNLVDTWALRPEAVTTIPNLFLASDYVRTHTDLATMEGANEAARRAVNGLLDAVKFSGARCEVWPLYEPEILKPWRLYDAARYQAGLPWDNSLVEVATHAIGNASPLLEQARALFENVTPFVNDIVGASSAIDLDAIDLGAAGVCLIRKRRCGASPPAPCLALTASSGRRASSSAWIGTAPWSTTRSRRAFRRGSRNGISMDLCGTFLAGQARVCGPRCASRPLVRWAGMRRTRFPPARAWKCCTTRFSCTTTLRTGANGGAAFRQCIAAPGFQSP